MIEIQWRQDPTDDKSALGQMFIDGVAIQARVAREGGFSTRVKFADAEGTKLFLSQRFEDLPSSGHWSIGLFKPPGMSTWWGDWMVLDMPASRLEKVRIAWATPNLMKWNRPWSYAEYVKEIRSVAIEMNAGEYVGQSPGFWYELRSDERLDELRKMLAIVTPIHEQAEKNLAAQIRPHSVVTYFDFPPEVKTACGQYLLYFGQFLADLGVAADCEVKEELGQMLFAVTPTTAKDALDKIRTALGYYLHIPTAPTEDAMSYGVELQRLIANVQHLKGQLALAFAGIQYRDATIEAQRTTIGLLTGEIVAGSLTLTNAPVKAKNEELILDGLVAIRDIEGPGYKIALPEIWRRLKKLFAKEI